MAFNFPNPPLTIGQIFTAATGLRYQWDGTSWNQMPYLGTADPFNYIVNPTFSVSQENGNTAGTAFGYYPADQWRWTGAGVYAFTTQRVQVVTPNGSANRLRTVVTTAEATSGADGRYATFYQAIEGSRVAGFRWGTANAQQVILRFGWKSPAGTWSIKLQNFAGNRAYITTFTVSGGQANTDTEQIIVIPGDTTGTWAIDSNTGVWVMFSPWAQGATYSTSTVGWSTFTSAYGITGSTNGMATVGNTFELFDVALYADPDLTGLAPKWRGPTEPENMMACLRYWYPARSAIGTVAAATACGRLGRIHPVSMRISPTVSVGTVGGAVCYSWTLTTASPITSIANYSNTTTLEFDTGNSSGGLSGNACSLLPEYPGYLAVSARM
jgi:hypothetical protein